MPKHNCVADGLNLQNHLLAVSIFGNLEIGLSSSAWERLTTILRQKGVIIWDPATEHENVTHYLSLDFKKSTDDFFRWLPKSRRILIATEPVTTNARQYTDRVQESFWKVLIPSALYPTKNNSWVWPQGGYLDPFRSKGKIVCNRNDRQGVAIIAENKFSFARESNYSLRTQTIVEASRVGIDLKIAGNNWTRGFLWTFFKQLRVFLFFLRAYRFPDFSKWTMPIPRRFRAKCIGYVQDEIGFLGNSKVAIVIENESSYVSEKLYLALRSGSKCVYVGPKIVQPFEFPQGFLYLAEPLVESIMSVTRQALSEPYYISENQIRDWFRFSSFAKRNSTELRNDNIAQFVYKWIATSSE
jgi:hypothetical protein